MTSILPPAIHDQSRRLLGIALLVFVVSAAWQSVRIARPFVLDDEGSACGLVMIPPINYLRYGPFERKLGAVANIGLVNRENLTAYVHHPPGVTITSATAHALLGRADWVARLMPCLFTALLTTLLFHAIARHHGVRAGILAAGIFAVLPITVYFGGMPDYVNSQVIFFAVLTLWMWLRSLERPTPTMRAAVVVAMLLAGMSDWPGFYVAAIIWIAAWAIHRRFDLFSHVVLPGIAAGFLFLLAVWMQWAGTDVPLLTQFLHRTGGRIDVTGEKLDMARWLNTVLAGTSALHTLPVLACLPIYLALWAMFKLRVFASRAAGLFRADPFVLMLIGMAMIHFLIARQGCTRHAWWHVPFTPAIACCAAMVLETALRLGERRWSSRWPGIASVVTVIVAIAAWSTHRDAQRRAGSTYVDGYTLQDLGLVIRSIAAEHEAVITSDTSDWPLEFSQPALGWYADRQLRSCVVDAPSLEAALRPGPYVLFYGFRQPSGPAPRWFVMPAVHRTMYTQLAAILDERYSVRQVGHCHVYDLQSTPRQNR